MASEHYCGFIKEAFVDPIRSILIVDDDYPTYDEILAPQSDENSDNSKKSWHRNPEQIRGVVRRFRENDPPLLVDIHDGRNVAAKDEQTVATHLHQSDLLILDYVLDKSRPNDGTLAIEILRKLMSNDHFNLVVVYTNETDLDVVFDAVRWGLISPLSNSLSEEENDDAKELIANAEDFKIEFYRPDPRQHWQRTVLSLSTPHIILSQNNGEG